MTTTADALLTFVAGGAAAMAAFGCGYLVVAAFLVGRFTPDRLPALPSPAPGVAVMKPLCGDEPWLYDNLASFCRQDYPGPVTLICGVLDLADGAVAVTEELRRDFPANAIAVVADPGLHGPNRKLSNLANMAAQIDQPLVVISDSDVTVERDYLSRVVGALSEDGVGCVTCLYYGRADGAPWSQVAALGIDAHFLPSVLVGLALGRAQPCFGSTIALRRTTLEAIGGFAAFADRLADDYAIGQAVRATGARVAIPPFAVAHQCAYAHWHELWAQELRWARTIRSIDPAGHAGAIVMHPFAWAFASLLAGGGTAALALAAAAIICRLALLWRVEQAFGIPRHPYWLIPMRDLFSAAVYVASYFGRDVVWRGRRYRVGGDGKMHERRTEP